MLGQVHLSVSIPRCIIASLAPTPSPLVLLSAPRLSLFLIHRPVLITVCLAREPMAAHMLTRLLRFAWHSVLLPSRLIYEHQKSATDSSSCALVLPIYLRCSYCQSLRHVVSSLHSQSTNGHQSGNLLLYGQFAHVRFSCFLTQCTRIQSFVCLSPYTQ